ncbi:MAG: hypothetical protein WBW33_14810 [Bryobacteraceae bacterium]
MTFCSLRGFAGALLLASFAVLASAQGPGPQGAQPGGQPPPGPQALRDRGPRPGDGPWGGMAGGTYTTVTGAISQFNYDQEAEVEGFLLSTGGLVELPHGVAQKITPSLHVGDSVTVGGMGRTSPTGFQTITAQSIKDSTSGKTLEIPTPGAPAPLAGSGKIQQLNYGRGGEINGFLLDSGVLAIVPPFGASNPSSIKVGATVSYSGYARRTMNEKTVVAVQSLTINGQQITLAPADRPGPGPDGVRGRRRAGGPPAAPAAGPAAPGAPAGRLDEPPPPPPPGDQPESE